MEDRNYRIYMDYQASTPIDNRVVAAMEPYLYNLPGNPHAVDHSFGWEANKAVEKAASQIAESIGADADEIIFTSGATESNNLAILGLAARRPINKHQIILSEVEHKCVHAAAEAAVRKYGCTLHIVPVDDKGFVDIENLESIINDNTLLVSIMSVNNEIGTIQDCAKIGVLCSKYNAAFHSDSAQALATGGVDVNSWNADLLSLSSHKIYGPKGIGALYIRRHRHIEVEPLVYGGGQQGGIRSGTLPVQLCVGFGEAASIMTNGSSLQERERITALRNNFVISLQQYNVKLNGPQGTHRHPGNANISFMNADAKEILGMLQPRLAASTGSACYSGIPEPSHVLRAIGLTANEAESSIRFSIGRFTTPSDIDLASIMIKDVLQNIKSD